MKSHNTFTGLGFSAFTIFMIIGSSSCVLKILSIKVPHIVGSNTTVLLESSYIAEGIGLMSMKWYKNGHEFFRYVTNKTDRLPSLMAFNVSGLHVQPISLDSQFEECGSKFCRISVDILDRSATGVYACEISSEPPDFLTHEAHQNLTVYDYPRYPPTLNRNKLQYVLGDQMDIQCSSAPSYPACNMTLRLNGGDVDGPTTPAWDVRRQIEEVDIENRSISNIYLTMMLTRNMVKFLQFISRNPLINVSCSCRLEGMGYKTSTKEMFILLRVPPQDIIELPTYKQMLDNSYASNTAGAIHLMKDNIITIILCYYNMLLCLRTVFAN